MTDRVARSVIRCLTAVPCLAAVSAHAEPYLAVQMGLKCGQCHINPTGGGMRTPFGDIFAQNVLPARHIDTGADTWTGSINRFISVGGDLRFDAIVQQAPRTKTTFQFQSQQTRIYLDASVIPDHLYVYVDEQVAPGGALNREAYAVFSPASHEWYVKAGQMYLPFGWRLQDQTAFILTATGINMTTPDNGVEFGWLRGHWDSQLAVSNGTAGAASTEQGKQYSGQLSYVESRWRLGLAANYNDKMAGSRDAFGIFGGLRTGPVVWLAQAERVEDRSFPDGTHTMSATLVEADWLVRRGNNVKVTGEFFDPNGRVGNNGQTRWSILYELTPIQFVQLRAGARYSDGIPQDPTQHIRVYFLEVHGFF